MDASDFDIGQGAAAAAPTELATLVKMAQEQIQLEERIAQLEAETKACSAALHKLRTGAFPEKMAELQMESFRHGGYEIEVKPLVAGSLPKDPTQRKVAVEWLEEHEGGDLIKTTITLTFNRDEREAAVELAKRISKMTNRGNIEIESSVHPQTLQAWARERLQNGEPIEFDKIGLYSGQITKIKNVDKKKGAKR